MIDLTLKRICNTTFANLYEDFLIEFDMNKTKYQKILSIAVVLINSDDKFVKQLGYRIIVIYCNQTLDYKPLYEISLNFGLIPITKFISSMSNYSEKETFYTELNSSFIETFFSENIYKSVEQDELTEFYFENINSTVSIVAPTSYGKTDLILSTLKKCKNKNVCIITPTKSLLAQTKMRIMHSKINGVKKIITHPEMFNENDENILAVLTQERLLRLLKITSELYFDVIIVDEAHGLLSDNDRSVLLASVIILLEKRNSNSVFKFLTPFLCKPENLNIKFTDYLIESFSVSEYIKTEKYYIYNVKENILRCYDQFLNFFIEIDIPYFKDDIDFIKRKKARKNIVYLNKPRDIEEFSLRLETNLNELTSEMIKRACKDISEYIHPNYDLIKCLRKGIIYHHGCVPDSVRLYIERLYSKIDDIEYVVTSSTLLEGVNLPAERMFVLDNKKGPSNLTPSNFKNLIGRVCRFSEIFNSDYNDLKKLEPEIYLVVGSYYSKSANVDKFLCNCAKVDKKIVDDLKNPLLVNTSINDQNQEKYNNSQEFLENYENGTIDNYKQRIVKTEVGRSCFLNNINEFDVFDYEKEINRKVQIYKHEDLLIGEVNSLFETIYELFLENISNDSSQKGHQNLLRFQYQETRNFYCMFLSWRIRSASYSEMINSFIRHWSNLIEEKKDTLVYVGRWGDAKRNGHRELWTDIKYKSINQRINLAIVRIKEEQDFLDNIMIKYVEVLNDLKFLEEKFYLKIKYGTDNDQKITLLKNGLSLSLANLLIEDYEDYILIDTRNSTVSFDEELIEKMLENKENQVLIYEAEYSIK